MSETAIFGPWSPVFRARGLSPRPADGKECHERGWQKPDAEQPPGLLDKWERTRANHNIALLMGTSLGGGLLIGALDVDHPAPQYVALARTLLRDPPCGRVGKKGAVFFFKYYPFERKPKTKFRVGNQLVAELLLDSLVIVPPSVHPDTKNPYTWLGTPLHELDFKKLPLLEI